MHLEDFTRIDPHLLVGIINTAIRNHHDSLDDLCRTHDIDPEALQAKLLEGGYQHQPEHNCFR